MDELIGRRVIIIVRAQVEQSLAERPLYQVDVEGFLLELSPAEFRIR